MRHSSTSATHQRNGLGEHTSLVPTITSELGRHDSPLRNIADLHRNVIDGWRNEALRQLDGKPTSILENKAWARVAGQGIDHRIRWWLTGFIEPVLPRTVTAGLDQCSERTRSLVNGLAGQLAGTRFGAQRTSIERDACLLAMAAGMAEAVFRARVSCPIDDFETLEDLSVHYRAALADIITMSNGLSRTLATFDDHETVEVGPAVRIGRRRGDADLVIDRCLVEVKAIVNPQRDLTNACRQLLAYVSMIDATVDEVALVLPRQKVTARFDVTRHRDRFEVVRSALAEAY